MRLDHSGEPVTAVLPRVRDRHQLEVLAVPVADLRVARLDDAQHVLVLQLQAARDLVHAGDELAQIVRHDEVDAVLLERLDRPRRPLGQAAAQRQLDVLAEQLMLDQRIV